MNDISPTLKPTRSQVIFLLTINLFVILIFAFTFTLSPEDKPLWLKEGGIIEILSAVGYFICAAAFIYWGGWLNVKKYHYFFLMIILFGMRELDFDKRFTTMGILKSRFYISGEVPLIEKIIGLMVIALLAYIVISIFKNHFKSFIIGIKSYSTVHLYALLTLIFLVSSKTLDGLARKLKGIGIHIDEQSSTNASTVEEILELAIPIIILSIIYVFFTKDNSRKSLHNS